MENKEQNSAPTDHQFQLVLVDDALIQRTLSCLPDLYLQLVKQPSFIKKQSLKYDYKPAPLSYSQDEAQTEKLQASDNFSQAANVSKPVKCNCCKTKCQKNYCECFKAGVACGSQCSCTECQNDEISIATLPKRNSGSGCKCMKSHCLKNYCECHSGGRKCSQQCRCLDCHNMSKEDEEQKEILELSKPRKIVKKFKEAESLPIFEKKISFEDKLI